MSSDGQGNIIINCQDCGMKLITIEVGKAVFHMGMSMRCVGCEGSLFRGRGGRAFQW